MNELKEKTYKNYTAWDLNVPQYVRIKNRQKLEKIFKRAVKAKMRQEVKNYGEED